MYFIIFVYFSRRDVEGILLVRVGSTYAEKDGQEIYVKFVEVHPKWNPKTFNFDFALLNLQEKLTWTDEIKFIGMPNDNDIITDGTSCFAVGWGSKKMLN